MSKAAIKRLEGKREAIIEHLNRFQSFLNNITPETAKQLQCRIQKVEELWSKFQKIQEDIEASSDCSEQAQVWETFENKYFETITIAKELLESSKPPPLPACQVVSNFDNIKLPQIQLPNFYGDHEKWFSFRDTFFSLIHRNPALANVQKFHYLVASLKGAASEVIRSLEVNDANYEIAWDLLKDRFENKRLIINSHLKDLFDMPSVNAKDSHEALRKLVDGVNKNLRALQALGQPVEYWDAILIYIISSKLDTHTKLEWEKTTSSNSTPKLSKFLSFLSERCAILETIHHTKKPFSTGERSKPVKSFIVTKGFCQCCKENHYLYECKRFLNLSVKRRADLVKANAMCVNCLRPNHSVENCSSKHTCKNCNKRHNTLLHFNNNKETYKSTSNSSRPVSPNVSLSSEPKYSNDLKSSKEDSSSKTISAHTSNNYKDEIRHVFLSTAMVTIVGANNKPHTCRALLDSGSQSNFISNALYKELGLKAFDINIPIHGVAESVAMVKGGVEATIKSRFNNFKFSSTFLILNTITDSIPSISIHKNQIQIPSKIPLADPKFYVSNKIDLLLGASVFWDLLCVGQIKSNDRQPAFQKTKLGWVAVGSIPIVNVKAKSLSCNICSNNLLSNQLEKFWSIEEVPPKPNLSKESILCKKHFDDNTMRDKDGRFIVKLPFKQSVVNLGTSYKVALKRFLMLENKFNKNPTLKADYIKFMREYQTLGHMSPISNLEEEINKPSYYLPHHGVYKDSNTTKLRVVFDASAKTTSDVSLNDILMVGPTIQQELFQIILRFRKHNIVITADVEKMYRQVKVHEEHRNFQRIIWRENQDEPIKHFVLNTVTYGTASASYLAIQCLQRLGTENKATYPTEAKVILSDFYVDDLLTGVDTPKQATELIRNLQMILNSGGFPLRKWSSNNKSILNQSLNVSENADHALINSDLSKTLGLIWNSGNDSLHYSIEPLEENMRVTKRTILSKISKLFDPLGLLGPIVIRAKMILQQLFQLNLGWDESVPMDLHSAWIRLYSDLGFINKVTVPRRVICQDPIQIELHGFCDASEKAYGACVYIRSRSLYGQLTSRLLCAKSRVAPLKTVSLPRLELCGALLLARLISKILSSLELNFASIHCWCDSTITLAWIRGEPNSWKTFVANRVSEIQQLTAAENWYHVCSQSNPADVTSRGFSAESLINSELWWNGPQWLTDNELRSSSIDTLQGIDEVEIPEKRVKVVSCHIAVNNHIFERFSTLNKLQRTIAYCFRFVNNLKNKNERLSGPLSTEELEKSLFILIKLAQSETFRSEINSLQNSKSIRTDSRLLSLNPFIDDQSILRVGGRLKNSDLTFDNKHQVLLPKKHRLTELIIMHEHKKNLHLGPRALLANIRLRFWIPNGLNAIKKVLKTCVVCFRVKPTSQVYQMSELPKARVTPSRPFTSCGVDFAGPFNIRSSKLRSYKLLKAYLCIFVCLATKAVHLEIVSDLTTEAFLNCLKRFISRRGKCLHIYSDNGTNFIGANNELAKVYKFLKQESINKEISELLHQDNINWHFIPARSPHFGGLWESAVKSAKYHIRRIAGNQVLTFEELDTLFTQVEACMNSRPLTPMSDNPEDYSALTPGHFLIGASLLSLPERDLRTETSVGLSRYRLLTQMFQHFWDRWRKEYLNSLQQRYKWRKIFPNVQLNSLVLIKEENVPPLKWPIGRIIQLHPGKDNIVRVVTIKTSNGTYKRSVNNICVLPIQDLQS